MVLGRKSFSSYFENYGGFDNAPTLGFGYGKASQAVLDKDMNSDCESLELGFQCASVGLFPKGRGRISGDLSEYLGKKKGVAEAQFVSQLLERMGILINSGAGMFDAPAFLKLGGRFARAFCKALSKAFVTKANAPGDGLRFEP